MTATELVPCPFPVTIVNSPVDMYLTVNVVSGNNLEIAFRVKTVYFNFYNGKYKENPLSKRGVIVDGERVSDRLGANIVSRGFYIKSKDTLQILEKLEKFFYCEDDESIDFPVQNPMTGEYRNQRCTRIGRHFAFLGYSALDMRTLEDWNQGPPDFRKLYKIGYRRVDVLRAITKGLPIIKREHYYRLRRISPPFYICT